MFAAEALGLKQIHATKTIRVPEPICWGIAEKSSYLVLEWLEFGGGNSQSWEKMGQNLARLHQVSLSDRFGWQCNNTIGSTPQINTVSNNWADFFAHQRIGYQLRLAKERGGNFPDEDQVIPAISEILSHHQPHPSLVHGDLWSGNAAITVDGEPVILDNTLKSVRSKCLVCQKHLATPIKQQMSALPSWRFEKPLKAFAKPLWVGNGLGFSIF